MNKVESLLEILKQNTLLRIRKEIKEQIKSWDSINPAELGEWQLNLLDILELVNKEIKLNESIEYCCEE